MTNWKEENLKFLGKQVEVTLDDREGTKVVAKGMLLGFCDSGEFEILEDDGFVHHCWPMLSIRFIQ